MTPHVSFLGLLLAAATSLGPSLHAAHLAAASPAPVKPGPAESAQKTESPIILFLVDNSASLLPIDPQEQRVAALEKMFTFVKGNAYRLILFGGRSEISVDEPSRYNNRGQWTDFYSVFERARAVIATYPAGVQFRIILITDGILDPDPREWADAKLGPGQDLKTHVTAKLLQLIAELRQPLYVILIGEAKPEGYDPRAQEQAPRLVLEMVQAANGARASAMAQRMSSFFQDDGLLLRKFIFRVAPHEGLKKVEPVVKRIVAPPSAKVEVRFFGAMVLPLVLFLFLMLGILVRSFPGPGDLEIVELNEGVAAHLAADKLRKTKGGWATTGLSLLGDAKEAAATLTYQRPQFDLSGVGLSTDGLDPLSLQLVNLEVDELRRALDRLSDRGTKEEKIYALNLDYMAKNFDPAQAERILTTPLTERRRVPSLDFLRAKAHLIGNDELRRRLTEPRLQLASYGKDAGRVELAPGATCHIGRYGFIVKDVTKGGRKGVRVVLYYDRVPSLLGLKTWLPDLFQRAFRLRRSQERVVS